MSLRLTEGSEGTVALCRSTRRWSGDDSGAPGRSVRDCHAGQVGRNAEAARCCAVGKYQAVKGDECAVLFLHPPTTPVLQQLPLCI